MRVITCNRFHASGVHLCTDLSSLGQLDTTFRTGDHRGTRREIYKCSIHMEMQTNLEVAGTNVLTKLLKNTTIPHTAVLPVVDIKCPRRSVCIHLLPVGVYSLCIRGLLFLYTWEHIGGSHAKRFTFAGGRSDMASQFPQALPTVVFPFRKIIGVAG